MPVLHKVFSIVAAFALLFQFSTLGSQLSIASSPSPSPSISALEKAQNDYNFQFTKLRDAQQNYKNARAEYLSFQTATAKNNAFVKTKDYLVQTSTLYTTFISLTKENANAINYTKYGKEKDKIVKILNDQTAFFKSFTTKVNQTKTLEELPALSLELKTYLSEKFTPKYNRVLASMEITQTQSTFDDFVNLSRVLDRVVVFKLRAGETKSILNNWSTEIKSIEENARDSVDTANKTLENIQDDSLDEGKLQEIGLHSQTARDQLKRSKPLFEEVVRII